MESIDANIVAIAPNWFFHVLEPSGRKTNFLNFPPNASKKSKDESRNRFSSWRRIDWYMECHSRPKNDRVLCVHVGKMLKFSTYHHVFTCSSATTLPIQLAIVLCVWDFRLPMCQAAFSYSQKPETPAFWSGKKGRKPEFLVTHKVPPTDQDTQRNRTAREWMEHWYYGSTMYLCIYRAILYLKC